MGRLEIHGLSEIIAETEKIANVPDDVVDNMLRAAADVLVKAQRTKGLAYGVHHTGVTLESIKARKPKKTENGRAITISPQGTNADGNRNAEVAFINEYGKKGQQARPFIRDANAEAEGAAMEAADKIYDNWLKSQER